MTIKIYRLVYLTLAMLLLVEIGLEFRAHQRGWNTVLGSLVSRLSAHSHQDQSNNSEAQYGPTQDFPFRSRIVPIEKIPSIKRLWIASSSYAQDNYVAASQIFPNLLDAKLNQSGFSVQVLNAAKEGQSILGNLEVLKQLAPAWKPDFVLLYQMNLDIDELSAQYLSGTGGSNAHQDSKGPLLKPRSSWGEHFVEQTTVYQLLKENITARLSQSRILAPDIGEAARMAFRKRILQFVDTSRALGSIPVLCTFATSDDLQHQQEIPPGVRDFLLRYDIYLSIPGWFKAIDEFNDDIRQIGREENVLVIDINQALSGRPRYFRDFVHFTPEGHQMMAEIITQALLKNKDMLFNVKP